MAKTLVSDAERSAAMTLFHRQIARKLNLPEPFTLNDISEAIDELKKVKTAGDEAMELVRQLGVASDYELTARKETLELISELAIARKTIKALLKLIPE